MRAAISLCLMGASLPLGGCAALPFAPALADVAYSAANPVRYTTEEMTSAATNGCRSLAYRYGRVTSIDRVEPISSTSTRVIGMIEYTNGARDFTCTFRNDGRITSFKRS